MSKRILVIDDDTNVARYIKFRLVKCGFEVCHVDNGIEGLEEIRRESPDLLILDMMMPGMDGRELVERIHEEEIYDPERVIVLSGKEEAEEMNALFKLGIHDYLQKPFNIDNLVVRIERALSAVASANA